MTCKKASYNPGLNPIKGKKFSPGTQTGSQDKCQYSDITFCNTCTSTCSSVATIKLKAEFFLMSYSLYKDLDRNDVQ